MQSNQASNQWQDLDLCRFLTNYEQMNHVEVILTILAHLVRLDGFNLGVFDASLDLRGRFGPLLFLLSLDGLRNESQGMNEFQRGQHGYRLRDSKYTDLQCLGNIVQLPVRSREGWKGSDGSYLILVESG